MTDHIEDGGPAFPTENAHQSSGTTWHHEGMSMRDYFAAKAMQGILAGCHPICKEDGAQHKIPVAAYMLADEMLKARKS